MTRAVVWVDGSGLAKAGPAGAGYVARVDGGSRVEDSVSIEAGTNQVAELVAAAYALEQLGPFDDVVVWSDSEYVVKGMTRWLPNWVERDWRTASGSPVKNQEHWRRLIAAAGRHGRVEFRWCKGHADTWENNRADVLAGRARLRAERAAVAARYSELRR